MLTKENGKYSFGYGMMIPKGFLYECFGMEAVKNKDIVLELEAPSYESLPWNRWPGRPERKRKMKEKDLIQYHSDMEVWVEEGCKQNRCKETKILYTMFLESYYGSRPQNINFPIMPEETESEPTHLISFSQKRKDELDSSQDSTSPCEIPDSKTKLKVSDNNVNEPERLSEEKNKAEINSQSIKETTLMMFS